MRKAYVRKGKQTVTALYVITATVSRRDEITKFATKNVRSNS
jgi:hypothetical protein